MEIYHRVMGRLLLSIALLCAACYASPADISFTGLPAVFQNNNYNVPDATGATYNGWSTATIDGVPGQLVICDDYSHTTYIPSSEEADLSTLTGPDPLQYARFSGLQTYETAAVLVSELASLSNPSDNTVTDYQYALWNLFDSAAPANATQQSLISDAQWLVLSDSPLAEQAYARLAIYTPTEQYASNQEMLGLLPTPEPATAPMLAALMVSLLAARSWGRRKWLGALGRSTPAPQR